MHSDFKYWEERGETYGNLDDIKSKRTAYNIIGMIKPMGINAGSWILDAGCGRGDITRVMRNNFRHSNVVGVDLSKKMISGAQHKVAPGLRFFQDDAFHFLKDVDEVFDLITMNLFLHHLTGGKDSALLELACDSIKPNGHILITEAVPPSDKIFNLYRDIFTLKEDRNCYSLAGLLKMVRGAGFEDLKFHTYRFDIRLLSWLNDNTLTEDRRNLIYRMHTEAPTAFKKAYAMQALSGKDYSLRCKMAIITGKKS